MSDDIRVNNRGAVLMWAVGILMTVNLSITGFIVTNLMTLNIRVAQIEANRFTSEDARKLMEGLLTTQRDLERALAKLPNEIPPQWFKAEVENALARLERKVDRIETRLDPLEHRER